MPDRSVMALVSILQRHGLSSDVLEDMVYCCERKCTGSMTLHVVDGVITLFEDHCKRRVVTGPAAQAPNFRSQDPCVLTKLL